MTTRTRFRSSVRSVQRSTGVFLRDARKGLLGVSHNGLAVIGLGVVVTLVIVSGRTDLREGTEAWALDWLQQRSEARSEADADADASVPGVAAVAVAASKPVAVSRVTAVNLGELSKQQAAVAKWIARRYNVALEPVGRLVQEAWSIGQHAGLDPTLILAVAAIESRFNPFAQSAVGAQGLMQVMTRVHTDKFEAFGGAHAAFDPVSNLKVGVQVLRECIARAGSLEAGLRWYVGAANTLDDGGYLGKVLSEQSYMKRVAGGGNVSPRVPIGQPQPAPTLQDAALAPAQAPKAAASAAEQVALLD